MKRKTVYQRPYSFKEDEETEKIRAVGKSLEKGQLIELGLYSPIHAEDIRPVYFKGIENRGDKTIFEFFEKSFRQSGRARYFLDNGAEITVNAVMSIHLFK